MYTSKIMDKRRLFPNYTTIVIAALAVIGSILVIFMGVYQPHSSTQTSSINFVQATKEIIPSLDMSLNLGDTTLYVPKGATNLAGYLSIIPGEPLFSLAADSNWTHPIVVNIEYLNYQGTPAPSTSFFKPVQVCFQINEQKWQDYTRRPAAYQVEYYAESLGLPRWVVLPMNTNPERHQLCGETDHLSLFALAIKVEDGFPLPVVPLPLIPVTGETPFPTNAPTVPTLKDLIPTKIKPKDASPTLNPNVPPPIIVPTLSPTMAPPPAPTDLPPAPTDLPPAPTDLPPAPTDLPPAPTDLPPAPTEPPAAPTDLPAAPTDLPV